MTIWSHCKEYEVVFINSLDIISQYIGDDYTFFVVDHNVYRLYLDYLKDIPYDRLKIIEALETQKNMSSVLDICESIINISSKRNTHLISIGGGITQDITGFVSNVIYRGIRWTFFPSTLLAACDSCIGGKTSLNYKGYKNLLGTFYPPDSILIYTKFFETLSERDYLSGLGEVVKFNIMTGADGINCIETALSDLLKRDSSVTTSFIENSLLIKKGYIEEDEFDKGKRILLNYAHTFGHAFEVSSNYEIPHGTAVALGMVIANRISVSRGLLNCAFAKRIEDICTKIMPDCLRPEWFEFEMIIDAIHQDKKQIGDSIRAILINNDLSLNIYDNLSCQEIKLGVAYLRSFILGEM